MERFRLQIVSAAVAVAFGLGGTLAGAQGSGAPPDGAGSVFAGGKGALFGGRNDARAAKREAGIGDSIRF